MFGCLSRSVGNARRCCIATSHATEHKRASSSVCETIRRGKSLGMRGSSPKDSPSSKPRHPNMWPLTGFLQTSASIRSSPLSRSNNNHGSKKEKKGRGIIEPLPLRINLRLVLRQRFDVEKELETARLLNAQQEANVDGGAIRDRRREGYHSGRHRRIEATTIRL